MHNVPNQQSPYFPPLYLTFLEVVGGGNGALDGGTLTE